MKTLLTAAALFIASFASAQIVNIPDSNFKKVLVATEPQNIIIDTNGDGEIELTEAEAITELFIGELETARIMDYTGIRSFINLKKLTLNHPTHYNSILAIAALDLSGLTNLEYLYLEGGAIRFDVEGCTGLKSIISESNDYRIGMMDISSCPILEELSLVYSTGSGMDPEKILNLRLGNPKKLKKLVIQGLAIDSRLDLTTCDSLSAISLSEVSIRTLDISGLTKINSLVSPFFGWKIDSLIARNCTGLTEIDHGGGHVIGISFLDVYGCINLERIYFDWSNIETLDLNSCVNLKSLDIGRCSRCSPLRYLSLKNGSISKNVSIYMNGYEDPKYVIYVCADEFEVDDVRQKLLFTGLKVNINPYCSFFPVGNYNTINGKSILDIDNNGCDASDRGMPGVPLKIMDDSGRSLIRYTAPSGDYAHYTSKGNFTFTPYFPYPYFTVNPSTVTIGFDTANNLTNITNFCISPDGIHNDLEITFLPRTPSRPGFNTTYQLVYKNKGNTILSGNVQLNFDNTKMNFITASETVTSQNTGQLKWNYSNLNPFESRLINVTFNLLPPPINTIEDTLTYLATIDPSAGDETPYDNLFILPQRIRGSYDPNDKLCLEGDKIDISAINKPLHYAIHFQNMGNDTAFNVVVADTLSNKLDWDSFEFIGSSDPCAVKQTNNKLEFIFENIKLPYKSINEPASNGFVAFKIKPKNTVVIGDSLNNKAAIYFDFNPPVITNLATTIVSSANTPVPVKIEYFAANNKGAVNLLNWKAACTNGFATFSIERSADGINFNSIGKLTASSVRCQLPFNFTDKEPVAGKNHYRLKITDADGLSFYSKILVVGINKPGIVIKTIISNKNNSTVYFNATSQQMVQVKIIAADGKLIYAAKRMITAGNSQMELQLGNIAKGIYTLIVHIDDKEPIIKRFVK